MSKAFKKPRLYEEIIRKILQEIQNGTLQAGDRLPPEREFAQQLNVSRTSLREALRSLESMGYIESNFKGGTILKDVTLQNIITPYRTMLWSDNNLIQDFLEMRMLLETHMALLAAQRATEEDLKRMKDSIESMQREIKMGKIGIKYDDSFHKAIAAASGNQAFIVMVELCAEMLSQSRYATMSLPGQPQKTILDHTKIYEAIQDRDPDLAEQMMREHLTKARINLQIKQS